MVFRHFFTFSLLIYLNVFLHANGQLEEYFRWRQITFAEVERGEKTWIIVIFVKSGMNLFMNTERYRFHIDLSIKVTKFSF